jgi:hypothetical protein
MKPRSFQKTGCDKVGGRSVPALEVVTAGDWRLDLKAL